MQPPFRYYIAGPMRGIAQHNFPAFDACRDSLRRLFPNRETHLIISPADLTREKFGGLTPQDHQITAAMYEQFMREDLTHVVQSQFIVLLPGWEQSNGARIEALVGHTIGAHFTDFRPERCFPFEFSRATLEQKRIAELIAYKGQTSIDLQQVINQLTHQRDERQKANEHNLGVINEYEQRLQAALTAARDSATACEMNRNTVASQARRLTNLMQSVADQQEIINRLTEEKQQLLTKPKLTSAQMLKTADALVSGERQKDYGHPLDNFTNIAELLNAYLNNSLRLTGHASLQAENVADIMILLKIARLQNGHHDDSVLDIAGYAKTRLMVHEEREKREDEF